MSLSKSVDLLASAMSARSRAQEVHANNLANITTDGFMRERVAFTQALVDAQQKIELHARLDRTLGPAAPTGRLADVAMRDDNFLVVQVGEAERYVRGASLTLNGAGELSDWRGHPVLGEGGPITPGTADFAISNAGEVLVDGEAVGRLRVVAFEPEAVLTPVGGGHIASDRAPEDVEDAQLLPGHRQGSNVNLIDEMVTMVESNRLYEVNGRALRAYDEVLKSLIQTTSQAVR